MSGWTAARVTIAAIALLPLPGALAGTEVRALGGTFQEEVKSIGPDGGKLVVLTASRTIPLDQVKSIRFQEPGSPPAERRAVKLLLTTGDLLRGTVAPGAKEDEVVLATRALGEVRVKFGLLRGLVTEASGDRERELLTRAGARQEQFDEVFLREGGSAKGSVLRIEPFGVKVDTDVPGGSNFGQPSYDLEKVELVAMALLEDPPAAPPGIRVQLRLVDGSLLSGVLEGLASEQIKLKHPLAPGGTLSVPVSRAAELVVQNGAFVYLSDLDPESVDQRFPPEFSYSVEAYGWKRDRCVTGKGPLRLGGRVWDKGLGVHSYAALTYKLDGAFRQFRALVGLDDSTRNMGEPGFGAVVFKVLLDGKPAREYPTGFVARKGEPPKELEVDVSSAQRITLVADFDPTSLHVLGRADWADAHLIRK